MTKKGWIILGAVLGTVALLIALIVGIYNNMVKTQTAVEGKYAAIDTQLQRRLDLIPNLVETVKGYTAYEQSTLQAVTDARAALQNATTPEDQAAANDQLGRAVDIWVNAVTEAYPDLKANEQFRGLQDELAGTENRIAVARKDYNDAVQIYNTAIRRFPSNLFAGIFGFEKLSFFEANADAQNPPVIKL